MATVTIRRSDLFPIGTTVGIYPGGSKQEGGPPGAAQIASAVVDAAGLLTVTNGGIVSLTDYLAYALVNSVHNYARLRSTLDVHDYGTATGTLTTTSGSAALTVVSASAGVVAIGQRISGAGIVPGSYLIAGSGASWTMNTPATASASGVAFTAEGATPAVANLGADLVPRNSTRWQGKVAQRRNSIGTV